MNFLESLHFCSGVIIIILTVLQMSTGTPVGSSRRGSRSPHRSRTGQYTTEYDWLCPTAMCPPVSQECSTVEYMVFEYDVLLGNRVVSVRCQTCEYCLDIPFRARRSLFDVLGTSGTRHNRCSSLHCPSIPEGCSDTRLTDVFINGHFCKKCPACFDNTVVSVLEDDQH